MTACTSKTLPGGTVEGEFTTTGLKTGGLITEVTITSTGWTKLPATPLANRNAIAVQNQATVEMKINYVSGASGGYVGMKVPATTGERFYQITDGIEIYGRLISGADQVVIVEELA